MAALFNLYFFYHSDRVGRHWKKSCFFPQCLINGNWNRIGLIRWQCDQWSVFSDITISSSLAIILFGPSKIGYSAHECQYLFPSFLRSPSHNPSALSHLPTNNPTNYLLSFCVIELFSSLTAIVDSTLLASLAKSKSLTSAAGTGTMANASLSSRIWAVPT